MIARQSEQERALFGEEDMEDLVKTSVWMGDGTKKLEG
jgi:hypothetical protein